MKKAKRPTPAMPSARQVALANAVGMLAEAAELLKSALVIVARLYPEDATGKKGKGKRR